MVAKYGSFVEREYILTHARTLKSLTLLPTYICKSLSFHSFSLMEKKCVTSKILQNTIGKTINLVKSLLDLMQ